MKDLLTILMVILALWKNSLVFTLVKGTQDFVWACNTMVIIVISLLMTQKSLSEEQIIRMLTFYLCW